MKKLLTFAAMACLCLCAAAKTPKPTATAVLTVEPPMSCANCENKIKTNLRFEKGVTGIVTSLADQTVTVTYDPAKTNEESLIAALKKIGYKAEAACNAESGTCTAQPGSCSHCSSKK